MCPEWPETGPIAENRRKQQIPIHVHKLEVQNQRSKERRQGDSDEEYLGKHMFKHERILESE